MSACIVPLVSIFLPPTLKNEKTSQSSFTGMPPSQWWFSFIPCLSVCSSSALSASYILPPGFRRHLRRSLKIWLLEKAHRLRTRWDTSMSTVLGPFAAWYRISLFYFFFMCYVSICLPARWNRKTNQTWLFPAYTHIVCIGLTANWTVFNTQYPQGLLRKCISPSAFFVAPLFFFFFCLHFSNAKPW